MVGAWKVGSNLVLNVFGCSGYLLVHLTTDAWGAEDELIRALVEGMVEDEDGANEAMATQEVERLP